MNPRRIAMLLVVALLLLVAGCGSGSEKKASAGGLEDLLGYVPADAPFAVTVSTDIDGEQYKNANDILSKFPFSGQVKSELKKSVEDKGLNYEKDIKPLLGGEVIFAATDPKELMGENVDSFVGAVSTTDGSKLEDLIKREGKVKEIGEKDGAKLFGNADDNDVFAIDGDTLVVGTDRAGLEAALDRHDGGTGLKKDRFDQAFQGLPENPLARLYVDTQAILRAIPEAAAARNLKYIAGSRPNGITLNIRKDRVEVDSLNKTENLGEGDLPIAPGDESPGVVRAKGEVGAGWRDIARTIRFYEQAAQALAPEEYGKYAAQKKTLGAALDVDFDKDVIDQLSGNTYASFGFSGWAVRSDVKDPEALKGTLAKLARSPALRQLRIKPAGDDLYQLVLKDQTVFAGVVDKSFVISPQKARAQGFAALQPEQVEGARGAIAVNADGEALANQIAEQSGQGALGSFFTGPIGDFNGWAGNNTAGGFSHFELKIE